MDIRDCVALITGGGTGIGSAIASELCDAGARVMIAGRRADRLADTARFIQARGGAISHRSADVAEADECTGLVEATVAEFGPIDILVNNAGILRYGECIEDYAADDWDAVMAVNLRAAFLLSAAVLPAMRERQQGFILMVSSGSGVKHNPLQSLYGLSKHGMNDLVQFILAEYRQYGIHAAALCPGLTATEMGLSRNPTAAENLLSAKDVAAWARWVVSQPDNMSVARPIVFLTKRDPFAVGDRTRSDRATARCRTEGEL